jgi:integrase
MAGTTKDANLSTRTSRSRLAKQNEPHWHTLSVGRAALGWQRPGRWLLRTFDGKHYSRTFLGRSDEHDSGLTFDQASAAARTLLDDPTDAASPLTVRAAMAAYVAHKRALGQPTTDLIGRTAGHILPTLGDKRVDELTPKRLRDWLAVMANMPRMIKTSPGAPVRYDANPKGEEGIRARRATANRVLSMLKAALNHAFHEGRTATDMAWRKVKPFRAVETARVRYLTVAEAQRLVNASAPDFRSLVRAALETGCRYGELAALEVSDFNPDAGTVAIRKSKTGKPRHVVLTAEGAGFFRQHCAGRVGAERMFQRDDGAHWGQSHQTRPMADACKRATIKPAVGFHQLRHTWASLATMNGVPLMVIARNLGHVDTRMVEKFYGHLAPSYIVDAIRAGAPRFGIEADAKVTTLR